MTNNFSNFQTQQGFQMPQFPNTTQANTNNTPQQPLIPQMSPMTNIFPQPNGSIYVLNSSNEIGNIPVTAGLSAGICLNENTLTIKTIQNGAPAQLFYKLVPANETPNSETTDKSELDETLKSHKLKIESLERQVQRITEKVGGKLEWQM